jgi:proline iminopeptidase
VSFERANKDLEELRVHLGLERMALIGFSGYGMEMALYALAHPGRVSRLVQLAPIPPTYQPWGEEASAARAARMDQKYMKEFEDLKNAKAPGEAQCRAVQKGLLPAVVAYPERFVEKDFDYCANINEWPENTGRFYGKLLASLPSQDLRPRLPELKFPRLVIHAAKDTFPLAGSEAWVAGQPEARILVIQDAGHAAWRDQPQAVLSAIETFLSGGWPEGSRQLAAAVP